MLLAVPSIIGAGLLSGISAAQAGVLPSVEILAIGSLVSFLTAYASISLLLRFVGHIGMTPFVVYRIALGAVLLLLLYVYAP